MPAPQKIIDLVKRFEENWHAYTSGVYNETQLRREFLDPFFKELGWDIDNEGGLAEAYKDVVHEDAIKIGDAFKAPDYCFRVGGTRKFFVEAKKPFVKLADDVHPAFQVRRYAWSANLPLSILTDFEEFAVYDCRIKPLKTDKPSSARLMYLSFRDYIPKWDEIAGIFSRDAVLRGAFDQYAGSSESKRGVDEVDKAFLSEIKSWRELLAKNIALRNSQLSNRELNFTVQRTIDRIIFLRICEDRGIEDYGKLKSLLSEANIYKQLLEVFARADTRYNSGLFHFREEKDCPEAPDEITTKIKIDDSVLKNILNGLYYPESPYEFSVLPVEILGQVYEQFLGQVIHLTQGHHARIEEKPEVKKAGGVYYTPRYIVEYIVKNTLGKLLDGITPKQAVKLRVLDPACGSGSFLIGAYRYLLDWHRDWYVKDGVEKWTKGKKTVLYQHGAGDWRLTVAEKKRILLNNIYGVDIDSQAVEVTKLSLLLKVLEGEDGEAISKQYLLFHERVLPGLGNNIKCGNSLISPDIYNSGQMELWSDEDRLRVNAFDWDKEFPEIMSAGGFDAVIGNPPYVKARDYTKDKQYYRDYLNNNPQYQTLSKMWDLYVPFIEKGGRLLKRDGCLGMIVPDTIEKSDYASLLREWLIENFYVYQIDFFPCSKIFISVNKIVGVKNTIIFISNRIKQGSMKRIFHQEEYRSVVKEEMSDHNSELFVQHKLIINLQKIKTVSLGDICFTSYGLRLNSDKNDTKPKFIKSDLLSEVKTKSHPRKFLEGKNLDRYRILKSQWVEWGTDRCPKRLVRPTFPELYEYPKLLLGRQTKVASLDLEKHIVDNTIIVCFPYAYLSGTSNGSIRKYFLNVNKPREGLENLSKQFDLYFLLSLINSKVIKAYIKVLNQDGIDMFPDDWKKLPIPAVPIQEQKPLKDLASQMIQLNKYFREAKTDHEKTAFQRQINTTDAEIDRLVYELYGLTEEEIKVVEDSTKKDSRL